LSTPLVVRHQAGASQDLGKGGRIGGKGKETGDGDKEE
jgi:hypothetical protein